MGSRGMLVSRFSPSLHGSLMNGELRRNNNQIIKCFFGNGSTSCPRQFHGYRIWFSTRKDLKVIASELETGATLWSRGLQASWNIWVGTGTHRSSGVEMHVLVSRTYSLKLGGRNFKSTTSFPWNFRGIYLPVLSSLRCLLETQKLGFHAISTESGSVF